MNQVAKNVLYVYCFYFLFIACHLSVNAVSLTLMKNWTEIILDNINPFTNKHTSKCTLCASNLINYWFMSQTNGEFSGIKLTDYKLEMSEIFNSILSSSGI